MQATKNDNPQDSQHKILVWEIVKWKPIHISNNNVFKKLSHIHYKEMQCHQSKGASVE